MSDMPPPPPDDSGWSSQPPPPPGPASDGPQAMTGWATLGTGGGVQLAGAGSRLGARIIDGVIMTGLVIILFVIGIASALGADAAWTEEDSSAAAGVFVGLALLAVLIGILYEVTLIAVRGQTLGKMAVRIKVVRADNGLPPGWGKSIGRWIIPAALGFIPFIGWLLSLLVYISLLWDKVRQGWHDKAAGTLVIKA